MATVPISATAVELERSVPQEAPTPVWRTLYERWFNVIWGVGTLVLFFVAWEVAMREGWIDPFFISSPSQILAAAQTYLTSSEFAADFGTTAAEFLMGFGISVLIG